MDERKKLKRKDIFEFKFGSASSLVRVSSLLYMPVWTLSPHFWSCCKIRVFFFLWWNCKTLERERKPTIHGFFLSVCGWGVSKRFEAWDVERRGRRSVCGWGGSKRFEAWDVERRGRRSVCGGGGSERERKRVLIERERKKGFWLSGRERGIWAGEMNWGDYYSNKLILFSPFF